MFREGIDAQRWHHTRQGKAFHLRCLSPLGREMVPGQRSFPMAIMGGAKSYDVIPIYGRMDDLNSVWSDQGRNARS